MTSQKLIELKEIIEESGSVTVTVVGDGKEPYDETYTSFDEAKSNIEILENTNEVYF